MRRLTVPVLLLVLALALAACGGSAPASGPAQAAQPGGNGQNGPGGRSPFGNQDPNAPLPLASALAVGTIKLDNTAQAVTPDEAKQLIPLWQGLQSLMSSDTSAQAEVEGVVNQIQSTMSADQVSAITAMNLKGSDETSVFSQGGFASGGPNAQGTPRADVTPGAAGSGRRFRGGFGGAGGGDFAFRSGGFAGPGAPGGFAGGPGGGAGLPGAGGGTGSSSSNSAAQSQRATAQARSTQFQSLGVNPFLVRVVLNYLQGLTG
jgi:hypothetical protein